MKILQRKIRLTYWMNVFLLIVGNVFSAQLWADGGTLTFTGNIKAPACTLNTSNIDIPLGDNIKISDFKGVGSGATTSKVQFTIPLTCQAGTSVHITLQPANIDNRYVGTMKVDSGSGSASGIGIQLLKSNGIDPLPLNQDIPVGTVAADGGFNISWYAQYLQTDSNVTSGQANAQTTFTLNYL